VTAAGAPVEASRRGLIQPFDNIVNGFRRHRRIEGHGDRRDAGELGRKRAHL